MRIMSTTDSISTNTPISSVTSSSRHPNQKQQFRSHAVVRNTYSPEFYEQLVAPSERPLRSRRGTSTPIIPRQDFVEYKNTRFFNEAALVDKGKGDKSKQEHRHCKSNQSTNLLENENVVPTQPYVKDEPNKSNKINHYQRAKQKRTWVYNLTRDPLFSGKKILAFAKSKGLFKPEERKRDKQEKNTELTLPNPSFLLNTLSSIPSISSEMSGCADRVHALNDFDDARWGPQTLEIVKQLGHPTSTVVTTIQIFQAAVGSTSSSTLLLATLNKKLHPCVASRTAAPRTIWTIYDFNNAEIARVEEREFLLHEEEASWNHQRFGPPSLAYRLYATSPLFDERTQTRRQQRFLSKDIAPLSSHRWADFKQQPNGLLGLSTKYTMMYHVPRKQRKQRVIYKIKTGDDSTKTILKCTKVHGKQDTFACAKLTSASRISTKTKFRARDGDTTTTNDGHTAATCISNHTISIEPGTDPLVMSIFLAIMDQI